MNSHDIQPPRVYKYKGVCNQILYLPSVAYKLKYIISCVRSIIKFCLGSEVWFVHHLHEVHHLQQVQQSAPDSKIPKKRRKCFWQNRSKVENFVVKLLSGRQLTLRQQHFGRSIFISKSHIGPVSDLRVTSPGNIIGFGYDT